jgi:pimeloyl-ACP methyl ester carboxylesterase
MSSVPACSIVRRPLLASIFVLILGSAATPPASAQEDEDSKPKQEEIVLTTKDGVQLSCTYYNGLKKKDSTPVILLHDFKGNRHDWDNLASELQKTHGFAVISVDLRGHGDSTARKGQDKRLEAEDMPIYEFPQMVGSDLETVKTFLMEKNNDGKLNIDKLSICGAGMGGLVGMLFTKQDWSWPVLSTGKQGQDVKAVFMLSPLFGFKGMTMQQILTTPEVQSKVSVYVAVGRSDSKSVTESTRVYNLFKPYHRFTKPQDQDLWLEKVDTKLQGTKLLSEPTLGMVDSPNGKDFGHIAQFLDVRAASQPYPWAQRKTSF